MSDQQITVRNVRRVDHDAVRFEKADGETVAITVKGAEAWGIAVPPWDPPETITLPKSVLDQLLRLLPETTSEWEAPLRHTAQAVADAVRAARSDKGEETQR